jgi:protocatechuate 3,4-dioxygenase, alpha subunit
VTARMPQMTQPVPPLTPSQTVGPFFALGLPWAEGPHAVAPGTAGAFWLRGRVLDGAGDPVPDALVESWQADPDGRFDHPDDPRGASGGGGRDGFRGFGRSQTDDHGRWGIYTVRPGRVPDLDGRLGAPYLNLSVFARGLLDRVVTRAYLPDEPAANAEDPVLAGVDGRRRGTLVAVRAEDGFMFDIRLQGVEETVFFDV